MEAKTQQYAAFRHKGYRRYFASRFLSGLAIQIVVTALSFQMWEETGEEIWLGLIGLVQFLPLLGLVVVTGMAADKIGRRVVMASSIIGFAVCSALFLFIALSDNFSPVTVILILVLFGSARAFHFPASASLCVNLVPKEDFPNAVGWVTSTWQLATAIGPAIGGILQSVSTPLPYGIGVVCFALSACCILSIKKPKQILVKEPNNLSNLLSGFRYVWKTKIVLGAITLDLFALFLGGAMAMIPIYATEVLNGGEVANGFLRAAPGIGAIIVAFIITRYPVKDHAGRVLLIMVALFGGATVLFGLSNVMWLSILALMLVGAFDMVSVVIREVLLQLWTPDEMRGRVNAVNSVFLSASNELGDARAGLIAAKWGAVFTVVSGGILALGVVGIVTAVFPELRKVRKLDIPEELKS